MPNYQLGVIPIGSLSFVKNQPNWTQNVWANENGTIWNEAPGVWEWTPENGSQFVRESIVFSAPRDGLTTVGVEDDDNTVLQDDPQTSYWPEVTTTQTLDAPVSLNGVTYAAGTTIENEYEVNLLGSDGAIYRMTAISLTPKTDPSNPTSPFGVKVIAGFTFDGEWPHPDLTLTYIQDSAADLQQLEEMRMSLCFASGVLIRTEHGDVAVDDLAVGDLVATRDNGLQPVRWIGSKTLDAALLSGRPELRPIRIKAGALGDGAPFADLVVSPQHRVLVRSRIAMRMFGTTEVLVAAKQLLSLDGIEIADDLGEVEYFHLLFDRHEVLISNGAETESLYTGPVALRSVGRAAREEIFSIFPELRDRDYSPVSARLLPSGRQSRKLAMRHRQSGKALT